MRHRGAPDTAARWQQDSLEYFSSALGHIRNVLRAYGDAMDGDAASDADAVSDPPNPDLGGDDGPRPALAWFASRFGLTPFDERLILLCASAQVDSDIAHLCARANGNARLAFPTFDLALRLFNGGRWFPFSPQSTLRRWALVELEDKGRANLSALRLPDQVLSFIASGIVGDPEPEHLLRKIPVRGPLVPSHDALARQIGAALASDRDGLLPPIVRLEGHGQEGRRAVARAAVDGLGLRLFSLNARFLPQAASALDGLVRTLDRDAILFGCGYLIEACDDAAEKGAPPPVAYLLQRLVAPCLVVSDEPLQIADRTVVTVEVTRPTLEEQEDAWREELTTANASALSGSAAELGRMFDFDRSDIESVCAEFAVQPTGASDTPDVARETALSRLKRHGRRRLGESLGGLAQVLEPDDTPWSRLVLPEREIGTLQRLAAQVRHRHTVHREWGFPQGRGSALGIGCLFHGPSGTGKTFAARVVASALELDLYHVDLSTIASKYIGETEKNLERVFRAAEKSGAILFFDEADALFGKRSQVKDSHDRYANMTTAFLLQRMDAFSGLAILATNLDGSMDDAFARRLRFIVPFPFPGPREREAIWRGVFPPATPVEGLRFDRLARVEVSGGIIRNIALSAAFRAAADSGIVTMRHVRQAVNDEFGKLERSVPDDVLNDW